MDEASLQVLRTRSDIACVLVNPLQAMHPNASAPGDSALMDSARSAHFDRSAYAAWLAKLRLVVLGEEYRVDLRRGVRGFSPGPRRAQEYFGVRADMVTYGKTLGGGLPVGAVCGRAALMKRFREDRPADICFAPRPVPSTRTPTSWAPCMSSFGGSNSEAVRAIYRELDQVLGPARRSAQ